MEFRFRDRRKVTPAPKSVPGMPTAPLLLSSLSKNHCPYANNAITTKALRCDFFHSMRTNDQFSLRVHLDDCYSHQDVMEIYRFIALFVRIPRSDGNTLGHVKPIQCMIEIWLGKERMSFRSYTEASCSQEARACLNIPHSRGALWA